MTNAVARSTDPRTSHDAAGKVDATALERIVLDTLRQYPGGLTSHEINELTKCGLVSISPRMKPLETRGLIERRGRRDGRTVWRLTPPPADSTGQTTLNFPL